MIMNVTSFSVTTTEAFNDFIINELSKDFHPTLCIAYTDSLLPYQAMAGILDKHGIQLLGTTSAGEISDDRVHSNSFSGLLMDINPDYFKVISVPFDDKPESEAVEKVVAQVKQLFTNPGILVYASGIGTNGDSIVNSLKSHLHESVGIFGGLAADAFRNKNISVFSTTSEELDGLGIIVFDCDKIRMTGGTFSGWEGLGRVHRITKATGNVIYEIDDRPALDLFMEYFGDIDHIKQEGSDNMFLIPGIYPLQVAEEGISEYMRSVLLYDKQHKSLILAGEVQIGQAFRFCPPPDFGTVDNTVKYFKKIEEKTGAVDCVIINSCAGRNVAFGPMFKKEVKKIYDVWKSPTAGFLALGEIGNLPNSKVCSFHNVSCSLLTLTEYV